MKAKTVTRLTLCAALLLFGASYTRPAHALPDHEIDSYWYTGCNPNLTLNGYSIYLCSGGGTDWGTQDGDWFEQYTYSCDPEVFDNTHEIWEKCGSTWERRTTLGDCQCSH